MEKNIIEKLSLNELNSKIDSLNQEIRELEKEVLDYQFKKNDYEKLKELGTTIGEKIDELEQYFIIKKHKYNGDKILDERITKEQEDIVYSIGKDKGKVKNRAFFDKQFNAVKEMIDSRKK